MTPDGRRVTCIAAHTADGVIGDGPRIPWRVPGEQAVFKRESLGHTLLMGRATYESIGRPLPGRTTIVLTRDAAWTPGLGPDDDRVLVAGDLEAAVSLADARPDGADVVVAGGGEVYAAALDVPGLVDRQVLSEVDVDPGPLDAPIRYPSFDREAWVETGREPGDGYVVVTLERALAG